MKPTLAFVTLAALYALPVFSLEIPLFRPGFLSGALFLGALALVLAASAIAIRVFLRDRSVGAGPAWVRGGVLVLFALWFPACATGSLQTLGDHAYFARRASGLRALASRIERHAQVHEMSDGRRYWKTVNGIAYRGRGSNPPQAIPLAAALQSAHMSQETFEHLRRQIIRLGIIRFESGRGRVNLVVEGFLDNYVGFLHVLGGSEPRVGAFTAGGTIVSLTRVAPGWYVYRTS